MGSSCGAIPLTVALSYDPNTFVKDSLVVAINLQTRQVQNSWTVYPNPTEMVRIGNALYVACYGDFSGNLRISRIQPGSSTVTTYDAGYPSYGGFVTDTGGVRDTLLYWSGDTLRAFAVSTGQTAPGAYLGLASTGFPFIPYGLLWVGNHLHLSFTNFTDTSLIVIRDPDWWPTPPYLDTVFVSMGMGGLGYPSLRRFLYVEDDTSRSTTNLSASRPVSFTYGPNPASQALTWESSQALTHLSLWDRQGRCVRTFSPTEKTLFVGDLPAGLYILHVRTAGGSRPQLPASQAIGRFTFVRCGGCLFGRPGCSSLPSRSQAACLWCSRGPASQLKAACPPFGIAAACGKSIPFTKWPPPKPGKKSPASSWTFTTNACFQLAQVQPNAAHTLLKELEDFFTVIILTQNVDDLHERAGSSYILHLHGELTKARSTCDPSLVYEIGYAPIRLGDLCEKGSQLRPHVVWFGEEVPAYPMAESWARQADIFVVIGSSLQVYPAAGLLEEAIRARRRFLIDPRPTLTTGVEVIAAPASEGVRLLRERLPDEGQADRLPRAGWVRFYQGAGWGSSGHALPPALRHIRVRQRGATLYLRLRWDEFLSPASELSGRGLWVNPPYPFRARLQGKTMRLRLDSVAGCLSVWGGPGLKDFTEGNPFSPAPLWTNCPLPRHCALPSAEAATRRTHPSVDRA